TLFRPSRLRGGRHLCPMRETDARRSYDQPATARWHDGIRALARQALDRAFAERRTVASERAVVLDAEHRKVVMAGSPYERSDMREGPDTARHWRLCAIISKRCVGTPGSIWFSCRRRQSPLYLASLHAPFV